MFHLTHSSWEGCFGPGPDLILPCPESQLIQGWTDLMEWSVFEEESEVPRSGLWGGDSDSVGVKVAYLPWLSRLYTKQTLYTGSSAAGTYKLEKVDAWLQARLFFLLYFKFFVFESWEPMTGGDACLSAHAATSSTGEGWHSGVADDGQSSADSSRQEVSREKRALSRGRGREQKEGTLSLPGILCALDFYMIFVNEYSSVYKQIW